MTIAELVERYNIALTYRVADGEKKTILAIRDKVRVTKDNALDEIKSVREDIIQYLREKEEREEAAWRERQKKIDSIPGLLKIRAAYDDLRKWNEEFEKSFEDVGGLGVRVKPQYDFDSMYKEYPKAAAYLKAESYYFKSNYELSIIGKRALDKIIDGDYIKAIEEMEAELKEFTDRHFWD